MDDLISRKDAIKAIMSEPADAHYPSWYALIVCNLPPAEPELATNLQPSCNQLASDCISRQVAIDAFDGVKVNEENCTEYDIGYNDGIDFAISRLSILPSAEPVRCKDCKWKEVK